MIDELTVSRVPLDEAPSDWDRLVGEAGIDFYSSRRWQLAMAGLNGGEDELMLARDRSDRLRAVVPVCRYPEGPGNPLMHPGVLFGDDGPKDRRWLPVTIVGNASGYSTAPLGEPTHWAHAADRACTDGTAFVPYLTGDAVHHLAALFPDAPVLLTSLRVVVPVPGRTVEEYHAALTRSRRELVRRERRMLAKGDRTVEVEELTERNIPDLAQLQCNTQLRHGSFGDAAYFAALYRRVAACLAGRVFAFVCRHAGRAIGFMWAIRHGRTLVARSIGLDYDRVGRYAEYFNLMIHEPVRYCLEHGLTEIDMSVGSYPQKLLRGGRPILAWSLLLRPPPGWSPSDTVAHNRRRARGLLAELPPFAPLLVVDELARVAR